MGGLAASVIVAAAVLVVLVSALIAWDGDVPDWEREVLVFFNDWPDWLGPAMWVVQQPGVLLAPVIAGLIVVWFTREWRLLIPFVAVLPLKLVIEKAIVKQLVERERPFVSVGPEIEVRGTAFDGLSFPSGHSTTAFAMFILVSAFVPHRWRLLPLAGAVLVAVARLYHGEHIVLDVVAGAAMGTAFAAVLWFAFLNRWARP
jgi:undecaprenyl-diphosphatase